VGADAVDCGYVNIDGYANARNEAGEPLKARRVRAIGHLNFLCRWPAQGVSDERRSLGSGRGRFRYEPDENLGAGLAEL